MKRLLSQTHLPQQRFQNSFVISIHKFRAVSLQENVAKNSENIGFTQISFRKSLSCLIIIKISIAPKD